MRAILFALVLVACSPSSPSVLVEHMPDRGPVPPPSKVSPPEDDLRATCATLEHVGCPEAGKDSAGRACPDHLARIRAERVEIPTVCVTSKTTADGIRSCGDTSTLRFRCSGR